MLEFICIIFILIAIIISIISYNKIKNIHKINVLIDDKNNQLQLKNSQLISENSKLESENMSLRRVKNNILEDKEKEMKQLNIIRQEVQETVAAQKQLAEEALTNYFDSLDKDYSEKEKEYENHILSLYSNYDTIHEELLKQMVKVKIDLEKIENTRAAAIQAQIKEKEIKEQLSFYCLSANESDLADIKVLERMKSQLNKPRILSMLIWSTYWQKPMTALCNNILGTSIVTGIYKITNQETGECYIGQAADVAKRWKDHAKCGLGIDTPAGNKLYKAIQEYGIWNFSWELLEQCERVDLDEKERYYIQLYKSYEFGYNSNNGVKK
jgi:hypothetical protein